MMYVGAYNGLYLFTRKTGVWRVVCKIEVLNDSCRLFEQENERTIWIYTTDHVTRVELDNDLRKAIGIKEYSAKDGLLAGNDMYVSKVEGRVCFATSQGIYKFNPHKDIMEAWPDMNNLLNGASPYLRVLEHHDRLISLSPHEICIANLGTYKRGRIRASTV